MGYTYGELNPIFRTKKEAAYHRLEHKWYCYANEEEMDKFLPIVKINNKN